LTRRPLAAQPEALRRAGGAARAMDRIVSTQLCNGSNHSRQLALVSAPKTARSSKRVAGCAPGVSSVWRVPRCRSATSFALTDTHPRTGSTHVAHDATHSAPPSARLGLLCVQMDAPGERLHAPRGRGGERAAQRVEPRFLRLWEPDCASAVRRQHEVAKPLEGVRRRRLRARALLRLARRRACQTRHEGDGRGRGRAAPLRGSCTKRRHPRRGGAAARRPGPARGLRRARPRRQRRRVRR